MSKIHNQTLNLLQKLKQKKFSSQLDPNKQSFQSDKEVIQKEMKNSFLCSSHPSEIITNICLSDGQNTLKPLCPRCLQQHIKSHQQRSTMCKLQTFDTQLQKISIFLNQKQGKCFKLNQKINTLNEWKVRAIQQMKSELKKYKQQVNESIQSLFNTLQTQLIKKYQQQNKFYQQTVKVLQSTIPDLQQICSRSLLFLNQKKDLNSILLSLPQIKEKLQNVINNEKRMIEGCSINPQLRFNRNKLNEALICIRNSLQYKFNKINQFELDEKLKKINNQKQKQSKKDNLQQNLAYKNYDIKSPTHKLHSIDMFKTSSPNSIQKQKFKLQSSQRTTSEFTKTYQSQKIKQEDIHLDMLDKINNTTNRLKSSLNGFYQAKKQ